MSGGSGGIGIYVEPHTNNIGIGITAPTKKLHVVGDTRLEGNLTVNGTQTIINTDVITTEQIVATNAGTGPALIVTQTGDHPIAEFYDDGNAITLKIVNGGNVGMGTADPQQRLHVQGSILATTQHLGPTADTSNAPGFSWSGDADTGIYRPAANAVGVVTGGLERMRVLDNGNVGIGTTTPQGRLDVRGTTPGTGPGVVIIDSDANVGIGTTLPSAALHVTGSNQALSAIKVDQKVTNAEFPPQGASNIGAYPDYANTIASIDAGTPMTLAEFPPVGLTSATTTAGPITIAVSGAFYGNGNYITTASSVLNTSYPPWRAFDKIINAGEGWASSSSLYSLTAPYLASSGGPTTVSGVSYTGSWLQIELPSGINIKSYSLTPRANDIFSIPNKWVIAGSVNGATWTLLDSRDNQTNWAVNSYNNYSVVNSVYYTQYRIIILQTNGGSITYTSIADWKLLADIPLPTTAREYPPLPMTANTSYLNGTYGAGTYVASSSGVYNSTFLEYLAFDKRVVDDTYSWYSTNSVYNASGAYIGAIKTYTTTNNVYSGEWLQLKVCFPMKLESYQLSSTNNPYAPKQWYIVGSLDGTSWDLVDFRTAQTAWTNGAYRSYNVSSQIHYNYYRIIITNSNHTVTSSIGIAEWKLFGTQATYPKYRTALPATAATYSTGSYATYANSIYNATTVDAAPPLFLTDKTLTAPWKTGASNYTSAADASPIPSVFFELPSAIRLSSYTMTAATTGSAPSAWSVYGSNMTVAGGWLQLDARTSVVSPWTTTLTQTFAPTTATSTFDFFKFDFLRNCTSSAPGDFISLTELRLGGDDSVPESRIAVGADGRVGINTPPAEMNANSALTVSGNMTVTGNINAGNLGMFRNRIINGDMRIDQRRAGTSSNVTAAANVYFTDRWMVNNTAATAVVTAQQVRAPANPYGFPYALSVITTTAQASFAAQEYCGFEQRIEGFNIDDLMWGSQYAQPITISFTAYSTLAGTYSLALRNAANTASYVSSFSVPVANQWVRVEKTIPGETQATWAIDNTLGLALNITLASGTNWQTADTNRWANSSRAPSGFGFIAATGTTNFTATVNSQFFLTGVQVEKGTLATEFERRPFGVELGLCQRYYIQYKNSSDPNYFHIGNGFTVSTSTTRITISLPTSLRSALPLIVVSSATALTYSGGVVQPGTSANDIILFNGAQYSPISINGADASYNTTANVLNFNVTTGSVFSGTGIGIGLWAVGFGKFFGILAEL